jgi:hypothetical protein
VLRAAGDTETTQENIRDWLELDEGNPRFQLLTEEEIAAVIIFYYLFSSEHPILLNFPFVRFRSFFFFLLFMALHLLIRMSSPSIKPD